MQGIAEEGGAAWGEPCGRRVTGPPVDRKRSETDGEAQPGRRGEPRGGEPRGGEPGETETASERPRRQRVPSGRAWAKQGIGSAITKFHPS